MYLHKGNKKENGHATYHMSRRKYFDYKQHRIKRQTGKQAGKRASKQATAPAVQGTTLVSSNNDVKLALFGLGSR